LWRSGSKRRGGTYLNSQIKVNGGHVCSDIKYTTQINNTEDLKQQIASAFGWFKKDDIESCSGSINSKPVISNNKLVFPQSLIEADEDRVAARVALAEKQAIYDEKQAIYDSHLRSNRLHITVTLKTKEIPAGVSVVLNGITDTTTLEKVGGMHSTATRTKYIYTLQFSDRTTLSFTTPDAPGNHSDKRRFDPLFKQTLYNMHPKHIEAIHMYASDNTKKHYKIAEEIFAYINTQR
jgi:hypothetical protein